MDDEHTLGIHQDERSFTRLVEETKAEAEKAKPETA
jgi:hypothetical protein